MNAGYHGKHLLVMATAGVVGGGCLGDNNPPELLPPTGALTTATATIVDQQSVDGCSYIVHVDSVRYAPDAYSRAAIIAHMLPRRATVVIRYRITGNTGFAQCEAFKVDPPEISFVFVD